MEIKDKQQDEGMVTESKRKEKSHISVQPAIGSLLAADTEPVIPQAT